MVSKQTIGRQDGRKQSQKGAVLHIMYKICMNIEYIDSYSDLLVWGLEVFVVW
jgi:hypothetical protein